jgi:TPR repeat protein
MTLSEQNSESFQLLSEGFRFDALADECAEFPVLSLAKQIGTLHERLLCLGRRSAMVSAVLDGEIRRISQVCRRFGLRLSAHVRRFEGERAYRRGCDYFYGVNGFGLRSEKIVKRLGLSLLKQSADLGHSDGQYRYGRCLLYGEGCQKDPRSGVDYLKRSAEQGNSWAEVEYGKCLLNGLVVERDVIRGFEYVRRSARQLNPRGQIVEGSCLESGIGIERDLVRAAECYRLSAEQGNPDGQYNLGRCLENGIGIKKDLAHAAQFYRICGVYRHSGSCQSIVIPPWVRLLDQGSFPDGKSLLSVAFESGSRVNCTS